MDIENIDSNISNPAMQEDDHVEHLLSEKLMAGYVLLEKSCPVCSTPLVKNEDEEDKDNTASATDVDSVMIPKGSFIQPFREVDGVPFCVACTSHVVTNQSEIEILQKCGSLKSKGGILVAKREPPVQKEPEIIDVTKFEMEEKKEDEPIEIIVVDDEEVEETEDIDVAAVEYSVRREVATKVLGAKMLQGYSLLEKQCGKCGMPTMEYKGAVDCVVCPALAKKAKKQMKAQKKVDKESKRLETHISMAKANKLAKDIKASTAEEQRLHEEALLRERNRVEREAAEQKLQTLREKEAEQMRQVQLLEGERARVAAMEAEQARLVEDAKNQLESEAQRLKSEAALKTLREKEETMKLAEIREHKSISLEKEHFEAKQKRAFVESKIAEDASRLEEMDQRRKAGLATALESMNRDVLVAENRRRLEAKAALDNQITKLEQDIHDEDIETKTLSTAKREEDDSRMLELLEKEANAKAYAAEEAIRKAKAALEHVHSARREMIAQTIALAEQEVIAETEEAIKKEREGYKAPVILPSASEIASENWETLRTEGRAIMTRRVMAGWVLLAEFCQGVECHSSPLIAKDGRKECVVCGGCGQGNDGAYGSIDEEAVDMTTDQSFISMDVGEMPKMSESYSPRAHHSVKEIQDDFETKRNMVSKEIGKRMLEGWTLLDASCPNCVMPLMMDMTGKKDICVLCGLVDTMKETDGMTIKTADVPTKVVELPVPVKEAPTVMDEPVPAVAIDSQPEAEAKTMASQAQTKPYTDDAETMYSTIATKKEASEAQTKPSADDAETMYTTIATKKEVSEAQTKPSADDAETMYTTIATKKEDITLADSIRQNVRRSTSTPATPQSDPPASTKPHAQARKKSLDPIEISKSLSKKSEGLEITDAISAEALSALIMRDTSGKELGPSMSNEEVKGLVENYVDNHIDTKVSDEMVQDVSDGIQKLMTAEVEVTHLESPPRKFSFDRPPRPDHSGSRSPRRRTRTPQSVTSPQHGYVITSGASDITSLGGASRAESVASDALDSILDRIDAAKATLLRDDITVKEQLDAANLIEKLAQAAVAVKALEKIDS